MNENEHYEQKVLAMIREWHVRAYWDFDSRRMNAALERLIRRGVVVREVLGFPRWRFRINERAL